MQTRDELGKFLEQYNKLGVGAEVGVKEGHFSNKIAENWTGKILCVDIWTCDSDREQAIENLKGDKYKMIQGDSVQVSKTIQDKSLDWVYIDADHSYDHIKWDYEAWYPKVRDGGIICGHDYGNNEFGVKKFIDELGVPFEVTTDDYWNGTEYNTWIIKK